MLKDLCSCSDLLFVQEHWLLPDNLRIISSWDNNWDCYEVFRITDIESYALKDGRIYGGKGFLWHRTSTLKVKLVGVNDLHRVMAIKIRVGDVLFVVFGVYYPCYINIDEYERDILNL